MNEAQGLGISRAFLVSLRMVGSFRAT